MNLKSKGLWAGALGAVVLCGVVVMATSKGHKGDGEEEGNKGPDKLEFVSTDLARAEMRSLDHRIPLSGSLKPVTHAVLRSKISAVVTDVLVREGEKVSKGQVLARFDQSSYLAHLHEQEGNLEVAKAQLALDQRTHEKNVVLQKQGFISSTNYDSSLASVEMSKARVKAAAGQVESAQISLNDTVLRAPMSGVIGKRAIQPGEKVEVNAELVSVVDLSEMELQATVPTTDIASVKVGSRAEFAVDGFPDRQFTGVVKRINPEAEVGSRSITVFLSLDNHAGLLRGGMFAQGKLDLLAQSARLAIPQTAVQDGNGQTYVYWIDGSKLARANVEVGERDERTGMVAIKQGLKEGAMVVANRLPTARPGMQAVIKQTSPAAVSPPAKPAKQGV
ncbi:efflux RND transporter periplasmic adaptor subunit [Burkholderiaceae bacterium DAT-1]|nr:efflux RND transporter periplasmic adaptor subunit [Burkholderiaceae bacterium DAT-1]